MAITDGVDAMAGMESRIPSIGQRWFINDEM